MDVLQEMARKDLLLAIANDEVVDKESLWLDLVQRYTRCCLTEGRDRLPAIAGLARYFARVTGDTYLAGLWRSRLLESLLWSRTGEATMSLRPRHHANPSWSWVAVDCEVSFDIHSAVLPWATWRGNLRSLEAGTRSAALATVDDATTTQAGEQRYGEVMAGKMTISGWMSEQVVRLGQYSVFSQLKFASGEFGNVHFDNDRRARRITDITLLFLVVSSDFHEGFQKYPKLYALGLEPVSLEDRTYRRLGRVTISCERRTPFEDDYHFADIPKSCDAIHDYLQTLFPVIYQQIHIV